MMVADQPTVAGLSVGRRLAAFALVVFAQLPGWAGYLLTGLNRDNQLPPHWLMAGLAWFGLGLVSQAFVAWRLPYADPLLLPGGFALTGIGLAELYRLSLGIDAFSLVAQLVAVGLGIVTLGLIAYFIPDPRRLRAYPYLLSLFSFALLLLPLTPLGEEINGSRIWIYIGPFSVQPAELAKLVLAASFAAYLTETRDTLIAGGRRLLGVRLTRLRDIGPLLLVWGISLVIMINEKDLGTSLLFFGLFVVMLFVATGQWRWLVLGAALALTGAVAAWRLFGHVRLRVDYWLRPFDFPDDATQIISAQYGMATGGLLGSGWGLGQPGLVPYSYNDMISTTLAEEIGLLGLMGLILIYAIITFRGFKLALLATDDFTKLLACGLSFGFIFQTFAIIAGATRLLPLTGLTSPFLSQGGSSMIANWGLLGLLAIISHQVRRPRPAAIDLADEATMQVDVKQIRQLTRDPAPSRRLALPWAKAPAELPAPATTPTDPPEVTPGTLQSAGTAGTVEPPSYRHSARSGAESQNPYPETRVNIELGTGTLQSAGTGGTLQPAGTVPGLDLGRITPEIPSVEPGHLSERPSPVEPPSYRHSARSGAESQNPCPELIPAPALRPGTGTAGTVPGLDPESPSYRHSARSGAESQNPLSEPVHEYPSSQAAEPGRVPGTVPGLDPGRERGGSRPGSAAGDGVSEVDLTETEEDPR